MIHQYVDAIGSVMAVPSDAPPAPAETATEPDYPLPCPFCGERKHVQECIDMKHFLFYVVCGNCKAVGPRAKKYADALRGWNRREAQP